MDKRLQVDALNYTCDIADGLNQMERLAVAVKTLDTLRRLPVPPDLLTTHPELSDARAWVFFLHPHVARMYEVDSDLLLDQWAVSTGTLVIRIPNLHAKG